MLAGLEDLPKVAHCRSGQVGAGRGLEASVLIQAGLSTRLLEHPHAETGSSQSEQFSRLRPKPYCPV